MSADAVGAVVVTRDRAEVLMGTVERVLGQQPPPKCVLIIDNASDDGTPERLRSEFGSAVEVHTQPENLGAAAGRGVGMELVAGSGYQWCWLVDDDSPPGDSALALLLEAGRVRSDIGMVGISGGVLRHGTIKHVRDEPAIDRLPVLGPARECDFVLLDNALVSCAAIAQVGVPRADYFIMMEDIEYPLRLRQAGYRVLLRRDVPVTQGHLGSSMPWRGYYQTRNELLMVRDLRRPMGYMGWAMRQAKFVVGHLYSSDHKWERIRYRAMGAWHGIRGIRGRVVEPTR